MSRTKRCKPGGGRNNLRHKQASTSSSGTTDTGSNDKNANKPQPSKRNRKIHIKDGISIRKSVQTLKTDIRNMERLMAKKESELDDEGKQKLNTKLSLLRSELQTTESLDPNKVDKFDQMYRSVRFFERRKATRKIIQLRRQLNQIPETDVEQRKLIQEQLHDAEFNLIYVMHYPAATKYISLWPGDNTKSTDDHTDDSHHQQPSGDSNDDMKTKIRDHLKNLIDHKVINVADTISVCVDELVEQTEKKKTKKKGPTQEEVTHKTIGNLLRGVGTDDMSDNGEGNQEFDESDSSDENDSITKDDDTNPTNNNNINQDMDQDNFFTS